MRHLNSRTCKKHLQTKTVIWNTKLCVEIKRFDYLNVCVSITKQMLCGKYSTVEFEWNYYRFICISASNLLNELCKSGKSPKIASNLHSMSTRRFPSLQAGSVWYGTVRTGGRHSRLSGSGMLAKPCAATQALQLALLNVLDCAERLSTVLMLSMHRLSTLGGKSAF